MRVRGKEGSGEMDIPNADPCWSVRKGVRMQLGPKGQVRVKKEPWLAVRVKLYNIIVESATKAIGVSKLKKEQGLYSSMFIC